MDDSTLIELAKKYGTPLFVYDGDYIQGQCRRFKKAFEGFPLDVKFCYAVKANTNLAIMALIRKEGYGADIVSAGELDAVLRAGFKPEDTIYTSNGKSEDDMKAAVKAGINITADNLADVELLKKVGGKNIAFRVNPNVNPNTHPKISTALAGSKFGLHFQDDIAVNAVKRAKELGLNVTGIHCHIGSNIKETTAFEDAAHKMLDFAAMLKTELGIMLEFIDFGGGLGVRYKDEAVVTPEMFANAYKKIMTDGMHTLGYKPQVWFEPGRYIVAEAGYLLAKVSSVKKTPAKEFINVDAGFNNLVRPAMYDAYHHIRLAGKNGDEMTYDVAGYLCESGDILGRERMLPKAHAGDIVVVENSGAYGYSMASNYNSMPLPAEVMVRGGKPEIIRERQKNEELYIRQKIPKDLL